MRWLLGLAVVLACLACGKKERTPATAERPQAAMMPDSMPKTMPTADSTRGATRSDSAPQTKAAGPLRDSAFGPKFAVDSNGKVVPLKKKP